MTIMKIAFSMGAGLDQMEIMDLVDVAIIVCSRVWLRSSWCIGAHKGAQWAQELKV